MTIALGNNGSGLSCLELQSCQVTQLPACIGKLTCLEEIRLESCSKLEKLPASIGRLRSLRTLSLYSCSSLASLPATIGQLNALQTLDLSCCTELAALPVAIGSLSGLDTLDLRGCGKLSSLAAPVAKLGKLRILSLSGCGKLPRVPDFLGELRSLQSLHLSDLPELAELPDSMCDLPRLHTLNLRACGKLEKLPDAMGQLSCLEVLNLRGCCTLQQLPRSLGLIHGLKQLVLTGCTSLQTLPNFSKCESLSFVVRVDGASGKLERISVPFDNLPPRYHTMLPCFLLTKADALLNQSVTAISWIAILLATATFVGFVTAPGGTNSGGLVKVADSTPPSCSFSDSAANSTAFPACSDTSTAMDLTALRAYFICNALTFCFAITTALVSVAQSMPNPSPITASAIINAVIGSTVLLLLTTSLGVGTFFCGVFAVYPSSRYPDMYYCLIAVAPILGSFGFYIRRVSRLRAKWLKAEKDAGDVLGGMSVTAADGQ